MTRTDREPFAGLPILAELREALEHRMASAGAPVSADPPRRGRIRTARSHHAALTGRAEQS
jgi:hypothetical protein